MIKCPENGYKTETIFLSVTSIYQRFTSSTSVIHTDVAILFYSANQLFKIKIKGLTKYT